MEGFALRDAGDEARAPLAPCARCTSPSSLSWSRCPPMRRPWGLLPRPLSSRQSPTCFCSRCFRRRYLVCRGAPARFAAPAQSVLARPGHHHCSGGLSARHDGRPGASVRPCAAVGGGRGRGGFGRGGAALLVAEWARAVAVPIDQALVLCAFVVLTASFVGWILALLPLFGARSRVLPAARGGSRRAAGGRPRGRPGASLARPADTMRRLVSVTWLPLLGFAVYAFMTDVMAHSAFGVVRRRFSVELLRRS